MLSKQLAESSFENNQSALSLSIYVPINAVQLSKFPIEIEIQKSRANWRSNPRQQDFTSLYQ